MTQAVELTELRLRRRAWVAAPPAHVYELIADVSAMSRWSPHNLGAWFDPGHGPRVGDWFTGRNTDGHREWEARARIVEAEPGGAIAWEVGPCGDGIVRWRYTFRPEGGGTVVEESWTLLRLDPVLPTTHDELLAMRDRTADSVETTLITLAATISDQRN